VSARRVAWTLNKGAFDAFLGALSADRTQAAERYEQLRVGLAKFFQGRGGHAPEDQADEVVNRAARKLEAGAAVDDIVGYCHGIARNVLREGSKARASEPLDPETTPAAVSPVDAVAELRLQCLERCMKTLPADDRTLILEYHRPRGAEKIRVHKALAVRAGVASNTLRIRAFRIREKLESCVVACLEESER